MRIVSQIIAQGTIAISGKNGAQSGPGLALFVGFTPGDNDDIVRKMAAKICAMRVFPDQEGKTNLDIAALGGTILAIPNFTLYATLKKARRPSFDLALSPEKAEPLFTLFVKELRTLYPRVAAGVFGADMDIALVNKGPFTLIIDSDELWGARP